MNTGGERIAPYRLIPRTTVSLVTVRLVYPHKEDTVPGIMVTTRMEQMHPTSSARGGGGRMRQDLETCSLSYVSDAGFEKAMHPDELVMADRILREKGRLKTMTAYDPNATDNKLPTVRTDNRQPIMIDHEVSHESVMNLVEGAFCSARNAVMFEVFRLGAGEPRIDAETIGVATNRLHAAFVNSAFSALGKALVCDVTDAEEENLRRVQKSYRGSPHLVEFLGSDISYILDKSLGATHHAALDFVERWRTRDGSIACIGTRHEMSFIEEDEEEDDRGGGKGMIEVVCYLLQGHRTHFGEKGMVPLAKDLDVRSTEFESASRRVMKHFKFHFFKSNCQHFAFDALNAMIEDLVAQNKTEDARKIEEGTAEVMRDVLTGIGKLMHPRNKSHLAKPSLVYLRREGSRAGASRPRKNSI